MFKRLPIFVGILVVVSIFFISAQCKISLKLPEPHCCIIRDVNTNEVLGCVGSLGGSESACHNNFYSYGNTEFKSGRCEDLPECSGVKNCAGVVSIDGQSIPYLLMDRDYSCGPKNTSVENVLYQCSHGNITVIENCTAVGLMCNPNTLRCETPGEEEIKDSVVYYRTGEFGRDSYIGRLTASVIEEIIPYRVGSYSSYVEPEVREGKNGDYVYITWAVGSDCGGIGPQFLFGNAISGVITPLTDCDKLPDQYSISNSICWNGNQYGVVWTDEGYLHFATLDENGNIIINKNFDFSVKPGTKIDNVGELFVVAYTEWQSYYPSRGRHLKLLVLDQDGAIVKKTDVAYLGEDSWIKSFDLRCDSKTRICALLYYKVYGSLVLKIYGVDVNGDLIKIGSNTILNNIDSTEYQVTGPQVAISPEEEIGVVYNYENYLSGVGKVYYAKLSKTGEMIVDPQLLLNGTPSSMYSPVVNYDILEMIYDSGSFVFAYQENDGEPPKIMKKN